MNMKNLKYLVVAFLGMAAFSCQDAIDIVQPGELYEETTFQTVKDLQLGLNGVYPAMTIDNEISHASIWTDECRIGANNGGQGISDGGYAFVLNPLSDAAGSVWQSNYALINFSNRILRASQYVTVKPGEEATFNDVLAQAHILRAWGHFKLLCYFSTDLTDDNALGVILMDHVPAITEKPTRSTNGEVFAFIDDELATYTNQLTSNAANQDRNLISPDFVIAFKARMAAYRGRYTEALPLAQQLIDTYGLTPRNQYSKIWTDSGTLTAADNEVIFRLKRVQGDSRIGSIWATNFSTPEEGGSLIYEMSTGLMQHFMSASSDVRGDSFLKKSSVSNGMYPIYKYHGTSSTPMLNDAKIFRTSEMYFIKAEALTAAGDYNGAQQALQAVNNARYSTTSLIPTLDSAEEAWEEILKQRSYELCYEGHRYLDMKRLAKKANIDLERNSSDCAVNGACSLSKDSYKWTFPIPQAELQGNANIKPQQNPGY